MSEALFVWKRGAEYVGEDVSSGGYVWFPSSLMQAKAFYATADAERFRDFWKTTSWAETSEWMLFQIDVQPAGL